MNKDNKNAAEEARKQNDEREPIISLEVDFDSHPEHDLDDFDDLDEPEEEAVATEESSKNEDDDLGYIKIKTSTLMTIFSVIFGVGLLVWLGFLIIPPVYHFTADYFSRHILNDVSDACYQLLDTDLWLTIPFSLLVARLVAGGGDIDSKLNFKTWVLFAVYFVICVGLVEFWDFVLCEKFYCDYEDFDCTPAISRTLTGWMDAISCAIFFIVIPILAANKERPKDTSDE